MYTRGLRGRLRAWEHVHTNWHGVHGMLVMKRNFNFFIIIVSSIKSKYKMEVKRIIIFVFIISSIKLKYTVEV